MHSPSGRAAYVPASHGSQAVLLFAPGAVLEVPRGQCVQLSRELEPLCELKCPAGHGCHTMLVAAPAFSQKPPGGQGSQVALPTSGEKLPAGQAVQVSWPERGWCWPGAHGMQLELDPAPVDGMRVPLGQG